MPIFTFPDDAEWDETLRAVTFSVEIGEYRGTVRADPITGKTQRPQRAVAPESGGQDTHALITQPVDGEVKMAQRRNATQ